MDLREFFDEYTNRDWQEIDEGTIRLALIGVGWWTREHALPAIAASDFCETTVLVSGDTAKAQTVADGISSWIHVITYDEFHDGAAVDEYDAVYVCTPNALHLPFVETAASFGKHVLCEKPMEATTDRAQSLATVCQSNDVRLMVAYRMQTDPAIRRTRELVQNGFIGTPVLVHAHMAQRLLDLIPTPDQWRLDPDLAGLGTSITDLGIYPINTSRFVLDSTPEHVSGTLRSDADEFDRVPDERATFEVGFDNGVVAACSASQNAHMTSRFELVGTDGRITLDPAFNADSRRTLLVERGDTTARITFQQIDQMLEEFDYFADRIIGGGEIIPDGEHGLVDMRVIEAVYEAGSAGQRIQL